MFFFDLFSARSRGCFGCYSKPTPIIAVNEPAKGLRIQGQAVKKPIFSDGFRSSSNFDLDPSTLQSRRSCSSISTSTLSLGNTLSSVAAEPDVVNHGLNLWNESRLQWIGSGQSKTRTKQKRARALSCNSTYESILSSNTPFPQPIPLSVSTRVEREFLVLLIPFLVICCLRPPINAIRKSMITTGND
ncbi:hypothetical protein SAY86_017834 [Trapa natans]|uniref:Gag1-like clamp domain-containing protein n=1 Tax=Trapa natans TaxID=22666 RepID=A0AAN7LR00_TRANT|nr:hypothetical protein SAY86_017834 [Trapa natans]